ncbi:DUF5316 family protein [Paenibacillus qinlingensis]|uniref:DUF5316 domain-containing protein n=1 Tax=Paenibacillus qinlingensis TaxID=1837343 RepID=A0ABU1P0K1_9BACL|nr:DUF5316 family protein [Paenibacillus qinlingensis]MDR6553275.1 hypothetical protein [Paenibacillus qinlingensis]
MRLAKLSLISGLIIALIIFILSLFLNNGISQRISGGIGLILIITTILTSGSLISGDRQRANDSTESNNDKKQRDSISIACFLAAIPILILWGYLKYFI